VFDRGISFRAFIEDINHSSRGQYDEVRYVGRPERFITYKGMNRNVTFGMYLIAFSEQELDTIWARANMLNKLTFPIDTAGGFMTPPIAKLTIGNVFVNQAGYVENVDMRLQDIPWDIDNELPQAIKLNMTFNIIEEGFITQKATNPFAPASQLFGDRDISRIARDRGYDTRAFLDRQRAEGNAQLAQQARIQFTPKAINSVSQNPVDPRALAERQSTINQTSESALSNQSTVNPFAAGEGVQSFDSAGNPIGNP
jgi:hypothetical protein